MTARSQPEGRPSPGRGVWMAHYADWSAFVPFRSEVEALRVAVERSMTVTFCPFGEDPRDVFDPPRRTRGIRAAAEHNMTAAAQQAGVPVDLHVASEEGQA